MKCWLHALLHATCLSSTLTAILLAMLTLALSSAQPLPKGTNDLDARVDNIISLGAPGVLVRVRDGTAVWARAAGLADIARRRTAQAHDTWRIASITKIVTATIVLEFVDRNRIGLDMPIGHYLPELAEKTGRVTVRQLLNQTSGIADYATDASDPLQISAAALTRSLTSPRPPLDMLAKAFAMPRRTAPAAEHDYSNTNYLLLELLIERVTGRVYRDIVTDMIFQPLGLTKTGFPDAAGRLPLAHLRGYLPTDGSDGPFSDRRTLVDVTEHTCFLVAEGGLNDWCT